MKDEIWSASTLHYIIAIHTNRAKSKRLKTKEGCKKVEEVNDDDVKEEDEEDNTPLKCKTQDKEETSESKKAKSIKAKDSKDVLLQSSEKKNRKPADMTSIP